MVKATRFGRLEESPCFLEGAQRARNLERLRIFETAI
jgi:hypothetical protein